jgi:hypothetical protein
MKNAVSSLFPQPQVTSLNSPFSDFLHSNIADKKPPELRCPMDDKPDCTKTSVWSDTCSPKTHSHPSSETIQSVTLDIPPPEFPAPETPSHFLLKR